jgi:hypothetical protein
MPLTTRLDRRHVGAGRLGDGDLKMSRPRFQMVRAVVPPDVEKKLRDMAAKDGRSLSAMIARILMKAVERES